MAAESEAVAVSTDGAMTTGEAHLTEFHLFPKLSPELRLMIWQQYLSVPRIIQFEKDDGPRCPTPLLYGLSYEAPFHTRHRIPLLQVCIEARVETQKHIAKNCQLHFPRYREENGAKVLQEPAHILMDITKDFLYIRNIFEEATCDMSTEDLDSIRFVCLDAGYHYCYNMLADCHNLEELILVVDMNSPYDDEQVEVNILLEDVRLLSKDDHLSMEEYMQIEGKPTVFINHMNHCMDLEYYRCRRDGHNLEEMVNEWAGWIEAFKEKGPGWKKMPVLKIALRKMTNASKRELAIIQEKISTGADTFNYVRKLRCLGRI